MEWVPAFYVASSVALTITTVRYRSPIDAHYHHDLRLSWTWPVHLPGLLYRAARHAWRHR